MSTYYIDGRFVSSEEASVPAHDLAVLRGYGVFDFLRTYGGRPFKLREHIARLAQSAALIGMDELPWSEEDIRAIVDETLARNAYPEANIRIVITGGDSPDFITPQERPRLLVLVTEAHPPPDSWYRDGAAIVTVDEERYLPAAKSINYIPAIIALKKARQAGAIEALYVDRYGRLLEGTTTNIFAFHGAQLLTPAEGILPGITRGVILELAVGLYDVCQREMTRADLLSADELFITASNKEVVPIVRVDDAIIGDGRPGPRTRDMMARFHALTRQLAGA